MLSEYFEPVQLLEPLPYPIYFVCGNTSRWNDLLEKDHLPDDLTEFYKRSGSSRDIWSSQTYIILKRYGLNVHLVSKPLANQICVVPHDYLSIKDLAFNSYVVACSYDRGRAEICEQRIVLNKLSMKRDTDHFIPHWPQPLLQPRRLERGSIVKNLVFKGATSNLAASLKEPDFLYALKQLDINFQCTADNPNTQFEDWADYTEADVVLAVRDRNAVMDMVKPPIKLINAWVAGCPAIVGAEPAYRDLKKTDLDFIEVNSRDEVINALKRLKEDPDLFEAMVQNGFKRSQYFSPNNLAQVWRNLLAGPIAQGYEKWHHGNFFEQNLRPFHFIFRAVRHKQEYRKYNLLNAKDTSNHLR